MKLSGLVLFKNEAEYFLKECVQSMLQVCDEVVAIDTGSMDESLNVLSSLNDPRVRLYRRMWSSPRDYTIIKNWGIGLCSGDWVLSMDADEVLDDNAALIRKAVEESGGVECFSLRGRHYINHLAQEDATVAQHIWAFRLFRNHGGIRYPEGTMHGLPQGFRTHAVLEPVFIHHYGYVRNQCFNLQRFENNMRKLEMHTPDAMRGWLKSHVAGNYAVQPVSTKLHPSFIRKKFHLEEVGL